MNLIIDNQYFMCFDKYKNLLKATHVILEQCEISQKRLQLNRCRIAGANGVINLSVPLVGGRDHKIPVKDLRIYSGTKWQLLHWKSIESAYNRSPWFEFYRDGLLELYQKPFIFLQDWNFACLNWVMEKMKLDIPVSFTNSFINKYDEEDLVDLRSFNRFYTRDEEKRKLVWYYQVFEDRLGFLPDLSIIDLLFCTGPDAVRVLKEAGSE
jgi:WbqC-like protein family